ncbi:MAG: DUF2752 domain-containing protein [Flavobacteriales bacterium]|nr:DUF2752 domain-containing protein [Flavobacteriales bacterium]
MLSNFTSWLESHYLACPYKTFFDIDCLGCGMQRSFVELLKGNFVESFMLYPALIPLLFMLLLLPLHLIFKYKHGAFWLKSLFIFNSVVVLISYVIRLVL